MSSFKDVRPPGLDQEKILPLPSLSEFCALANAKAIIVIPFSQIAEIPDLTNEKVLENLKLRFRDAEKQYKREEKPTQIYTRAGPVIVALNPFSDRKSPSMVKLYDDSTQEYYANMTSEELASTDHPHLFEVAAKAYNGVQEENGRSQAIVINGESGAGKTEAVKIILKYLTGRVSSGSGGAGTHISQLLLDSSPALEAFGNAKTNRNDNSSRFGKYVRLHFGDGVEGRGALAKASMEFYLLEKPRVVYQEPGEQAYHAFNFLMRGCPNTGEKSAALRDKCGVGADPAQPTLFPTYIRLPDSRGKYVEGFDEANKSLETILDGADASRTPEHFWQVVAGIMHLGQVDFETDPNNEEASLIAPNETSKDSLARACALLSTWLDGWFSDVAALQRALCERVVTIPGQPPTRTPRDKNEAYKARDALAKAVYGDVFKALVEYCNRALDPPSEPMMPIRQRTPLPGSSSGDAAIARSASASSSSGTNTATTSSSHLRTSDEDDGLRKIGLLDIFGAEVFQRNSLSQLLINYANDKLQLYFTDIAVKAKAGAFLSELAYTMPTDPNQERLCSSLVMLEGEKPHDSYALFHILNDKQIFDNKAKAREETLTGKSSDFASEAFDKCGKLEGYITGGKVTFQVRSPFSRWVPKTPQSVLDVRESFDPRTWIRIGASPPSDGVEVKDVGLRALLAEKLRVKGGSGVGKLVLDEDDADVLPPLMTASSYVKVDPVGPKSTIPSYYRPNNQKGVWAANRARQTPNEGGWDKFAPMPFEPPSDVTFGVHHFGGPVFYHVDQFVERNYDKLDENLASLLNKKAMSPTATGSAEERKPVAGKFMEEMASLDKQLRECDGHFVRCIKPNEKKGAFVMDEKTTQVQLGACGVLYAAQVTQQGYHIMNVTAFLDDLPPGYSTPDDLALGWNSPDGWTMEQQLSAARKVAMEGYGLREGTKEQVGSSREEDHHDFIMGSHKMIFLKQSILGKMQVARAKRNEAYERTLKEKEGAGAAEAYKRRQMRDNAIEEAMEQAKRAREEGDLRVSKEREKLAAANAEKLTLEERMRSMEGAREKEKGDKEKADAKNVRLEGEVADLKKQLEQALAARDATQKEATAEHAKVLERDTAIAALEAEKKALDEKLKALTTKAKEEAKAAEEEAKRQAAILAEKETALADSKKALAEMDKALLEEKQANSALEAESKALDGQLKALGATASDQAKLAQEESKKHASILAEKEKELAEKDKAILAERQVNTTLDGEKKAVEEKLESMNTKASEQIKLLEEGVTRHQALLAEKETDLADKEKALLAETQARDVAEGQVKEWQQTASLQKEAYKGLEERKRQDALGYEGELRKDRDEVMRLQGETAGLSNALADVKAQLAGAVASIKNGEAAYERLAEQLRQAEANGSRLARQVDTLDFEVKEAKKEQERISMDLNCEIDRLKDEHEEEIKGWAEALEREQAKRLALKVEGEQKLADAQAQEDATLVGGLSKFSMDLCAAIKKYRELRHDKAFQEKAEKAKKKAVEGVKKAYAYLMKKEKKEVSEEVKERTEYIEQYQELNAALIWKAEQLEADAEGLDKENARANMIEVRLFSQASFELSRQASSCLKMIEALWHLGYFELARAECVKLRRANEMLKHTSAKADGQFVLWAEMEEEEVKELKGFQSMLDRKLKEQFFAAAEKIERGNQQDKGEAGGVGAGAGAGATPTGAPAAAAPALPQIEPKPLPKLLDLYVGNLVLDQVRSIGMTKQESSYSLNLETDPLKPLLWLAKASRIHVSRGGLLTPMEEIVAPLCYEMDKFRAQVKIHKDAELFSWAFPLPGIELLDEKKVAELLSEADEKGHGDAMHLAVNGGFVYFDANSKIVDVKPVVGAGSRPTSRKAGSSLTKMGFSDSIHVPKEGALRTSAQIAARAPTIAPLIQTGIKAFTWISADGEEGNSSGAFAYLYGEGNTPHEYDQYFCMESWLPA